ncbi:hypothetical protein ScPMuIL_009997 [Solemya velum]
MICIRLLKQNWFLIGLVLVIVFAKLSPDFGATGGLLKPEITVKYFAVSLIFLNSGLSLRSEDLTKALFQINIHVFIQCFTFLVFPMVILLLVTALESSPMNSSLLDGLRVLGCMPPPVSSAVILTKAVSGNEAAAIFNSAFGSFLGTVITPALILLAMGSTATVPAHKVFMQLSATVLFPLFIGQIIHRKHQQWLETLQIPYGGIGRVTLLMIIYTTFCDTFSHHKVTIDAPSLISIIFLIVVLQCCLLLLVFYVSTDKFLQFDVGDTAALMFCCTHKSLTLGIPIIKIIFGGHDEMSIISIPLLIYHPTQILLGGLLVPIVRSWVKTKSEYRYHIPMKSV